MTIPFMGASFATAVERSVVSQADFLLKFRMIPVQPWVGRFVVGPAFETILLLLWAELAARLLKVNSDRAVLSVAALLSVAFCSAHIFQNGPVALATFPVCCAIAFIAAGSTAFGRRLSAAFFIFGLHASYNAFLVFEMSMVGRSPI
jgi:hypothetical protein